MLVAWVVADGICATTTLALAVILLVTVKLFSVPTLVRLDDVTVEFIVEPVNASADAVAGMVIFALPLKLTPFINLAVFSVVAVVAFPTTAPVCVPAVLPVTLPQELQKHIHWVLTAYNGQIYTQVTYILTASTSTAM